MFELIQLAITLGIFVVCILLGLLFGRSAERRHFRNLERREAEFDQIFATQLKSFPGALPDGKVPSMVLAETVIASDYLKSFVAKLRNIFGGEVRSFESMLERARREVTIQLKERAALQGYNAICNLRLNSVNIAGNGRQAAAMATIIGTATAYDCVMAAGDSLA